jgi:hypothetical protein
MSSTQILNKAGACVRAMGLLGLSIVLIAMPAIAVESLPMPVAHYGDLCRQSGGSLVSYLNSGGVGTVQCRWSGHGRTECKVGANFVNVCGISCQSTACLKANPAHFTPTWPLAGGPASAALPPQPGGTMAPAN